MCCLFISDIIFPKKMSGADRWKQSQQSMLDVTQWYRLLIEKYPYIILSVMEVEYFFTSYNGKKLQLSEMIAQTTFINHFLKALNHSVSTIS